MGSLSPALGGRDLADPAVARAVQANAATSAIHQFAEKDALRKLGTNYFGQGEAGEKAFGAFAQNLVQWRAFGDQRAYGMMMQAATRHFERGGYSAKDAELKASGVIGEAQSDPTFAKLIANAYDQEAMIANDLTSAQTQVGAMEGTQVRALRSADRNYFDEDELGLLLAIKKRFAKMSANDISEASHREQAWTQTPMGALIDYRHAAALSF
jgi:conjugal transfer mating pair stabilization protein TraG